MDEKYQYLEQEDTIDIKSFIIKNLRYWYLFVFFLMIAFFIAFLVNKFTAPVYKVSTWILINEKEDPLELETTLRPSLYGNPYKLENEIGILKSKNLTKRVIENLNFTVTYCKEERFKTIELYHDCPFIVDYDTVYVQPLSIKFLTTILSDSLLLIEAEGENVVLHNYSLKSDTKVLPYFVFNDTVTFGDLTGNQYCRFRILPNFLVPYNKLKQKKYSFGFYSYSQLIKKYRAFDIESSKSSSILQLSLKCTNVEKGVAFLNKLAEIYLLKGIERDDKIAMSTINFIDSQLREISDSLRYSEDQLQNFRTSKKIMNFDFQAQQVYSKLEDLQNKKAELIVKSKYYDYLKKYLEKNNDVNDLIAPSSMDIDDHLLNSLIIELTNIYAERTELSFNSIKNNPYLSSLELKIKDTKAKLTENIDNIIKASNISLNEIESRINEIEGRIDKLPKSQRELLGIERKFKLNDAIYTFLLTKRSDIQISKASNLPSNEVLDKASAEDYSIVNPNKKLNLIIAFLLGIFVPAGIIYLKDMFSNRVIDKNDIQKLTNYNIIGHIIHDKHKSNTVVDEFPNSLVAESFRSLRTNFHFISGDNKKKIILITSIITGEGKSYTSLNLASVFAQNQKKVILIDFDLRKSKIQDYLNITTNSGLSKFLSNN